MGEVRGLSLLLELSFLLSDVVAVRFLDPLKTAVFLAVFLYETTGYKVLKLFVCAKTKHLFATTHCITSLKTLIDVFEEFVESKELIISAEHVDDFIGDMIREPTRETCSFSSCHNDVNIAQKCKKSDRKVSYTDIFLKSSQALN